MGGSGYIEGVQKITGQGGINGGWWGDVEGDPGWHSLELYKHFDFSGDSACRLQLSLNNLVLRFKFCSDGEVVKKKMDILTGCDVGGGQKDVVMDVGRRYAKHSDIVEHAYYIAGPECRTGSYTTVDGVDAELEMGQIGRICCIGCNCPACAIDGSEGQIDGIEHFGIGCGDTCCGGEEEVEGTAHGVALVGGEREGGSWGHKLIAVLDEDVGGIVDVGLGED